MLAGIKDAAVTIVPILKPQNRAAGMIKVKASNLETVPMLEYIQGANA